MSSSRYTEGVRLSQSEKVIIKEAFQKVFYPEDEFWIFGSRVDLSAKGGDIDIFIKPR